MKALESPSHPSDDMPFLEHLRELRSCLWWALVGVAIATGACLNWSSEFFQILLLPLQPLKGQFQLIGTGPADAFMVKLKVGFFAGLILSSPWSLYQVWKFIAPGLHDNERRFAVPFVASATVCFLLGVIFCFEFMFPIALSFFISEYDSIGVTASFRIEEYLSFATTTLLVFGGIFEMPILTFLLVRLGVLSSESLIQKGRYCIIGIFIIAALLTPPDIVSQLLLAGPMLVLYAICIGVARLVERNS